MDVTYLLHWMIMVDKKNKNQKGQSLFEFLVFMPLLVMLMGVFYSFGSSISMSINQQKAVRGYFFHLLKGNSYGINFPDLAQLASQGTRKVGMFSIGWRIKDAGGGKNSFGSCFKVSNIFSGNDDEDCYGEARPVEGSSRFIRAFTAFGICSNSYVESGGNFYWSEDPENGGRSNQITIGNCSLSN